MILMPPRPARLNMPAVKAVDLALSAEGLQRDRIVGAAAQRVGAGPDADRRAGADTAVIAGEVAGPDFTDRREHPPGEERLLGEAEVHAELANHSAIAGENAQVRAEHALELLHGPDDEAGRAQPAAFENAGLDTRLGRRGAGPRGKRG